MKAFKPYSPSRRFITVEDFSTLSKKAPEKSLVRGLRKLDINESASSKINTQRNPVPEQHGENAGHAED